MNPNPINAGIRIATGVLDQVFMSIIAMFFYLPFFISFFVETIMSIKEQGQPANPFNSPAFYIAMFGYSLYFCKDSFHGRSIAKRILKLQVVDNKTGEVASSLQCLVRNFFCILWPVEFIIAMTDTSRRLGDRVAGTKLVYYDPAIHKTKLNVGKIILALAISYGAMVALMQLISFPEFNRQMYSKTSYNPAASEELRKLLNDQMGEYGISEVKIYDTVNNSHLKYVSVSMKLKENYIDDDNSYRQLHDMTTDIIYGYLPGETFMGEIVYLFRAPGQYRSRSSRIGTMYRPR